MRVLMLLVLMAWMLPTKAQEVTVINTPTISDEQLDQLEDIRVYPNPNHDHFTLTNPKYGAESQLLIVDVTGRLMLMQLIKADVRNIEIQHQLDPGTYIIILKDSSGSKIGKLMVD